MNSTSTRLRFALWAVVGAAIGLGISASRATATLPMSPLREVLLSAAGAGQPCNVNSDCNNGLTCEGASRTTQTCCVDPGGACSGGGYCCTNTSPNFACNGGDCCILTTNVSNGAPYGYPPGGNALSCNSTSDCCLVAGNHPGQISYCTPSYDGVLNGTVAGQSYCVYGYAPSVAPPDGYPPNPQCIGCVIDGQCYGIPGPTDVCCSEEGASCIGGSWTVCCDSKEICGPTGVCCKPATEAYTNVAQCCSGKGANGVCSPCIE